LGKKAGIERRAFFLLGMPNETEEDLKLTESLIDEIKPEVVGFTILCPYPGTSLYQHKNYQHINWQNADEYSNDFWSTEHFSNQELHQWQAYFINKYKTGLCERLQND